MRSAKAAATGPVGCGIWKRVYPRRSGARPRRRREGVSDDHGDRAAVGAPRSTGHVRRRAATPGTRSRRRSRRARPCGRSAGPCRRPSSTSSRLAVAAARRSGRPGRPRRATPACGSGPGRRRCSGCRPWRARRPRAARARARRPSSRSSAACRPTAACPTSRRRSRSRRGSDSPQVRERRPDRADVAHDVRVPGRLPLGVGQLVPGGDAGHAEVVHEHVEAAERVGRPRRRRRPGRPASRGRPRRRGRRARAAAARDRATRSATRAPPATQAARGGEADAGAATGHERADPVEADGHLGADLMISAR